ncbi:hypothetical protein NIES22_59910 [Calothrix brevissima NIES-22]|nr:hypothetical protein NIES22_59910 [Calothrix brevissima NIES-22]
MGTDGNNPVSKSCNYKQENIFTKKSHLYLEISASKLDWKLEQLISIIFNISWLYKP